MALTEAQRKEVLLAALCKAAETGDIESGHADADDALIAYINDEEITKAYEAVGKWYA